MSHLTVTVLGCDGSHAGPGGAGSGYLLRHWPSASALWIDAGPGTFAELQQQVDPRRLTAAVLTHEHLDHCSDFDQLMVYGRFTGGWDREPLPVHHAPGVLQSLHYFDDAVAVFRQAGDGQVVEVGPLRLTFSQTDHPPVTLAVRADCDGRALGYSADSGPGWSFDALGPGLDLALSEATYTAEHEGTAGHMSGREAGRGARAAGVRRLVLTHRWWNVPAEAVATEAAEAFGRPVDTAAVGRGFSW